MQVAAGAMGPVIHKLGELLAGEYNLEKRVKKGAESLQTELEFMHAVLHKVGEVPSDQLEEPVRIWAGKVRDLSCDMEDAVDDFLVRVGDGSNSKSTNMNRLNKLLKKTITLFGKGKALHQISDAIKEAQVLAKELADLRKRYKLDMRSTSNGATIDPRVLALHKDVGELVGVDRTRDELIKRLICEDGSSKEKLKKISIVGVGGLGKTTLAKAVYEKIKGQFNCAAFVSVGQNPDIKKVLKDLLYGLDKEKFNEIHNTTRDGNLLIQEISEFLVDKRYLIVIDDLWKKEIWGYINCALNENKLHSWVITTTRNVTLAEALSSDDDMIHKMKPLSNEDSEILFHRRIFQSEEKCPEDMQVVSRDILKKCGGVPLAIITIASLLATNKRLKKKDEWKHLLNSIGRGVTQGDILKDMKRILSLSYYDLPCHLKICLLYLSIFPEDFEIEKDWLIWRWLAEGFIQCDKEESRLFEIGKRYFNELMNRSLIQPARFNEEGTLETCRIHDMVLELICSLSSEENFISILDHAEWHAPNPQRKYRRLSLHNIMTKRHNHHFDSTNLSKVRTFAVFCLVTCDWLPSLSSFQFLRVLDLGNCGSNKSSSGINLKYVGNLIHLRYLGLKDADVHELPVDIGKLKLLQTLSIRGTSIEELPASFVQLRHLICLYVNPNLRLPKGMGNLTSLEVLDRVYLSWSLHMVKDLSHLIEVRSLSINCQDMDDDLTDTLIESLGYLQKLQNLAIYKGGRVIDRMREIWMPTPHLRSLDSWDFFGDALFLRLPKWINSTLLPHLSTLAIDVEELQGDDVQIIGMLPALQYLQLRARRVMGALVVRADAFPSARCCVFRGFPTPPCLFPPGAMPMVQHLQFEVSAQSIASGKVDCGMGHLPSLEHVVVDLRPSFQSGQDSSDEVTETAKAWLRCAAEAHPRRPTIHIW